MQKQGQNNGSAFSVVADCGCKPSCSDTKFDRILSMGKHAASYVPLVDTNQVNNIFAFFTDICTYFVLTNF